MKLWPLLTLLLMPVTQVPMTQAWAGVTPVCHQTSVIQEMRRTIRVDNYYARLDSRWVTEVRLPDTRYVRCDVCVVEADIRGSAVTRSVHQCHNLQSFSVQILSRGFVVGPLR